MKHSQHLQHLAAAVATTLLVASAAFSAPQAQALPSKCGWKLSSRDVIATCVGGSGQFRVHLDCRNAPDRYSIWARPGQTVTAKCIAGHPYRVIWETVD